MPAMSDVLAAIKRDLAVCTAMQRLHALAGGPGSAATIVGEGRPLVILPMAAAFGAGAMLLGLAAGVGLGLALTGG